MKDRVVDHITILSNAIGMNGSLVGSGDRYIDSAIERGLNRLAGKHMTAAIKLESVAIAPISLLHGTVFCVVTVIASIYPNTTNTYEQYERQASLQLAMMEAGNV